jgi:hypothetical protein
MITGRKFQTQYHSVDTPARLAELQQIEVERLNTLGTMLHQFQSMMVTLQTEITVCPYTFSTTRALCSALCFIMMLDIEINGNLTKSYPHIKSTNRNQWMSR